MPVPIRRPAAAVLLLGALALTACTGSTGFSSGGSAGSAAAEPADHRAAAGAGAGSAASDAASKAGAVESAAVQPRVVRTAQVVVQVDDELSARPRESGP